MFNNDINQKNTFTDEEEVFEEYKFPQTPIEEIQRMNNYPNSYNPNFNPPNFPGNNSPVNFNNNNVTPQNLGSPPNYIPNKNDSGVKSFNNQGGNQGINKNVSQNSISFCLFQFTYIWERNGGEYWAFLLNADRVSISGLRWFGRRWVFFGVDLRNISSFICYRTNQENCLGNNSYRSYSEDIVENTFENKKKLYTNSEVKECVSKTLASLDIPESKDDFIVKDIGVVDNTKIQASIPCVKTRNTTYTINLEISYPENLDTNIKDKVINYANEASKETTNIISGFRTNNDSLNPLESFDNYTKLISKAISEFSSEFNSKLRDPEIDKNIARNITYNITQCKFTDNWKTKS